MPSAKKSSSKTGLQRILNALATLRLLHGLREAPKKQVAGMAEVSNSTLPSLLSRMTKKGLIEYGSTSETIILTDKGMEMADSLDVPQRNEEAHEAIKQKLKGKPLRIFEILADGKPHTKESIMKTVNCTNPSTFAPMLSRELRKPGYIHYPSTGTVQLADCCFPFGRD
jgi:predicted transcriptional regulator